jgi:hypothetical protein
MQHKKIGGIDMKKKTLTIIGATATGMAIIGVTGLGLYLYQRRLQKRIKLNDDKSENVVSEVSEEAAVTQEMVTPQETVEEEVFEETFKEEVKEEPKEEEDIEQMAIKAEIERSSKIGQFEQRLAKKRAEKKAR